MPSENRWFILVSWSQIVFVSLSWFTANHANFSGFIEQRKTADSATLGYLHQGVFFYFIYMFNRQLGVRGKSEYTCSHKHTLSSFKPVIAARLNQVVLGREGRI